MKIILKDILRGCELTVCTYWMNNIDQIGIKLMKKFVFV
jgi:hypothetical protein